MTFPQRLDSVLSLHFLGNTLRDYLVCLVAVAIGITLVKIFQVLVVRRLKVWFESTPTTWDDLILSAVESNAVPAMYLGVAWLGLRDLEMTGAIRQGAHVVVALAVTVLSLRILLALANQGIRSYWARHTGEKTEAKEKGIQGIITLAKVLIVLLAAVLLLDNLGFKISAFVAGLGVTGIAVALAAQAILGDLFGYFVIFFDQPFEVGHTIKVGDMIGEVEHIGLKTTRLRSVDGEQVIFANKFLTDNRIQNFKRMEQRRHAFTFEVDRDTPVDTLRDIPARIRTMVEGIPETTFDRVHFTAFGDAGPRFEVAYKIETPDFTRHLDIRQKLNLEIYTFFQKSGIRFAIPSHLIRIRGGGGEKGPRQADQALGKNPP